MECTGNWNIKDNVNAMCVDTKASHTSYKKGACVEIKKIKQRKKSFFCLQASCARNNSIWCAEIIYTSHYDMEFKEK